MRRTNISFDDNTRKRIRTIQKKTGATSITEVLRHAVALLEMAVKEEGSIIIIRSPSGDKEVLLVK